MTLTAIRLATVPADGFIDRQKVKLNYVFVLTQQELDQLLAFLKSL